MTLFQKIKGVFKRARVGLASAVPRGRGMWIPQAGVGGGGEYGALINESDITFAMMREPIAHRAVFTVAHDIFDNWFELKLEGDEKGEKSKEFDKNIQSELTRLKAKRELMKMAIFERAYGWAILVLGYEQEGDFELSHALDKTATALREIKAYGPPQIGKVVTEKNKDDPRYGLPVLYPIKRPGIAAHLKVHYSRIIHFATRRTYQSNMEEWKGLSVLYPIWDDLVTLRNIRWGMGQTMYRYGSGVLDITIDGASQEQLDAYEKSGNLSDLSARTYLLHDSSVTTDFKGTAGRALNPMNYYLPIMENISAGTGIPQAILRGVQAGALTGSEVNQQEYYGLISDEQSGYEPGIRQLINIIRGFSEDSNPEPKGDAEFKFDWQGGFELDEEKKARIEGIEIDTLLKKGQFMTRNEVRKLIDPELQDLGPEQGGDEILGKPQAPSLPPFEKGDSFLVTEVNKRGRRGQSR